MDKLVMLKNKDFIFTCLGLLLKSDNATEDQWLKLTSKSFCKDKFDMNYPVLQELGEAGSIDKEMFYDSTGHRRYYPDIIVRGPKRYIVCNDWYYGKNRDTRTEFVYWIKDQMLEK